LFEPLEIALRGAICAVVLSIPLAFFGARNDAPFRAAYLLARSSVRFLRAVPGWISARLLALVAAVPLLDPFSTRLRARLIR